MDDKHVNSELQFINFRTALKGFEHLIERTIAQKRDERAGLVVPKEGKISNACAVHLGMLISIKLSKRSDLANTFNEDEHKGPAPYLDLFLKSQVDLGKCFSLTKI